MITENLFQIRNNIRELLLKHPHEIQRENFRLIAVTKNHDVAAMREAIDAGVTDVGENRVQEALQKAADLERPAAWHLIGHLQTNKAKQAVRQFGLIHSVDSARLAREIDRAAGSAGKTQDILVQVNLAREESKFGIEREELDGLIAEIVQLRHVRLCGLMAIAPHFDNPEDVRPIFHEMYAVFEQLRRRGLPGTDMKWLSMGMSSDYEIAIEEGANMVRIGTSIFGQRQY